MFRPYHPLSRLSLYILINSANPSCPRTLPWLSRVRAGPISYMKQGGIRRHFPDLYPHNLEIGRKIRVGQGGGRSATDATDATVLFSISQLYQLSSKKGKIVLGRYPNLEQSVLRLETSEKCVFYSIILSHIYLFS